MGGKVSAGKKPARSRRRAVSLKEGWLVCSQAEGGRESRHYFTLQATWRQSFTLEEYSSSSQEHLVASHSLNTLVAIHAINPDHRLSIASRVQLNGYGQGILRYFGPKHSSRRNYAECVVGVELDEARGDCDGYYMGKQFFSCRPNHGIVMTSQNLLPATAPANQMSRYSFQMATRLGFNAPNVIHLNCTSFGEMQEWIFAISHAAFDSPPRFPAELPPSITEAAWFHGSVNRYGAENALLRFKCDGAFLIRQSQTESGKLVLSVFNGGSVQHVLLVPTFTRTENGVLCKVTVNGGETTAGTLEDVFIYLTERRPNLAWHTPLTNYVEVKSDGSTVLQPLCPNSSVV